MTVYKHLYNLYIRINREKILIITKTNINKTTEHGLRNQTITTAHPETVSHGWFLWGVLFDVVFFFLNPVGSFRLYVVMESAYIPGCTCRKSAQKATNGKKQLHTCIVYF